MTYRGLLTEETPLNSDLGDGLRSVRHKGNYIIYALDEEQRVVLVLRFPSIYKQL